MCLTAREGAPWKTRPGIISTIKVPPPGSPDPDDELKSDLKACQASNAVQCKFHPPGSNNEGTLTNA